MKWQFSHHISMDDKHIGAYRSKIDGVSVQAEIVTPVLADYGGPKEFGKEEVYFFIAGDEREFRTEKELIAAVKEGKK